MFPQGEKRFALDSVSAPRPAYLQLYSDGSKHYLTVLNTYKNAIYVYDYDNLNFVRSLTYPKKGSGNVGKIMCYYFKNKDSIYIFDAIKQRLTLTSDKKTTASTSVSLINNRDPKDTRWALDYPQHNQTAATPMLLTRSGLLFTGQYIWSIPEHIINKFQYTARINLQKGQVSYMHHYPLDIYASDYGWNDPVFTAVYCDLNAKGDYLIYSFPVSHDLYIADINGGDLKKVYAGSNSAHNIKPVPSEIKNASDPMGDLKRYIRSTDLYGGVKYDPYRKVYYRFLQRGATVQTTDADWKKKVVAVVIMDENFKYLGETDIGSMHQWNWENSFVTQDGLNIEYVPADNNESQLIFKIFTLKYL